MLTPWRPIFLDALLNIIFPPVCHLCREFIPKAGEVHICPACLARMAPVSAPLCTICGAPFAGPGDNHPCGPCISTGRHFDSARAAFSYEGAARNLIHEFKYRYKTRLRRPLATLAAPLLEEYVLNFRPDMLVPVPLHKQRLRSRGFNQAVLIGDLLSRRWHIPMERRALKRIRWTEPQVNLAAGERKENVKNAFEVRCPEKTAFRRVILVDDVFTTGSTVDECARVLKKAGAEKVGVITVARAPEHSAILATPNVE